MRFSASVFERLCALDAEFGGWRILCVAEGHRRVNGDAHSSQNFARSGFSAPHFEQRIAALPLEPKQLASFARHRPSHVQLGELALLPRERGRRHAAVLCTGRCHWSLYHSDHSNGWWTGFWKNKKDALSTSPQAGFLERSQSLWALWATPSSELHRETDRVLRLQLGRFAGSAFWPPALRVAWGGPAPRRGRSLVHVQWGVAP